MKNYNENDIRTAAYFNWLNSGCQAGNDLQNWNNALLQLSGKMANKSSSISCKAKTVAKKSTTVKATAAKKTVAKKTTTSKKK